jgi:hypothetical protein
MSVASAARSSGASANAGAIGEAAIVLAAFALL